MIKQHSLCFFGTRFPFRSLFISILFGCFFLILSPETNLCLGQSGEVKNHTPRIINIINFIRQCEPRDPAITHDVLYQTVVEQIRIMKAYNLPGTFLLQYDALMDPDYQKLLKELSPDQFELGAWWEIPQPLVERSGYKWRGRYPWDWHANVGFSTGYTPEEREKLVDTYMRDFKNIFGYFPKSVGSWFIDAHTLNYMYQRYGIVASCNCKDQIGTDGYTLWGGYWNQAYYPSKKNAYMPAQHAENQIPVPIFRMLGSDPIHQYDAGLGGSAQSVVTLEPVYSGGGGNLDWCHWYFREFVQNPGMAFAYVQAGQENSFTWKSMEKGFKIQMPIIDQLRKNGLIEVQTLRESGEWFRRHFAVTPPTTVCALSDYSGKDLKSVWFNSRFYRANLLWEKGTLRFRDIHRFDENIESEYLTKKGTSTSCNYYTLPIVDGFRWSSSDQIAGLRFKTIAANSLIDIIGGDPIVDDQQSGVLRITWPLTVPQGTITLVFDETSMTISAEGKELTNWCLVLDGQPEKDQTAIRIAAQKLDYVYLNHPYTVTAKCGVFSQGTQPNTIFTLQPDNQKIILNSAGVAVR